MTIGINQIRSGIGLRIDGNIYIVVDYSHVKPGKGSAFVRVKLKNVETDSVLDRTFRTSDRLDDVDIEERDLERLVQAVRLSPKYRTVSRKLIRSIGAIELDRRGKWKQAVKATKNKLHQVAAAYHTGELAYGPWLQSLSEAERRSGTDVIWQITARTSLR